MGMCRKTLPVLVGGRGRAGLQRAGGRAGLWNPLVNPCSRCPLWGIRAAGAGRLTSGGYITVQRLMEIDSCAL